MSTHQYMFLLLCENGFVTFDFIISFYLDFLCQDSLKGDVGEQRGSGKDGGDAAADVSDEGQDLVVPRVDVM